jgi:hypothetical protein
MYCKYKHDHSSEEVWVTTDNPTPSPHGKERPFHCEKCHYVKKKGSSVKYCFQGKWIELAGAD